MQSKNLLFALSVAAFSSCSTAYKTGQTPDDVYYSPAKVIEARQDNQREDDGRQMNKDYEITMGIHDRRWRDFREDYDFDNSPYNYTACNCKCNGYYYNPYYYPWAIYNTRVIAYSPVNTTPRMVNLNTYNGYYPKVASGKTNGTLILSNGTGRYSNSNRSSSRIGDLLRQTIEPTPATPSSNNSRTYTPSSSSSGSSSSGSNSSGSVTRPARGG